MSTPVTLEAWPPQTRLVEGEDWLTLLDSPATRVEEFMGQIKVTVNSAAKESNPEYQDPKSWPDSQDRVSPFPVSFLSLRSSPHK